MKDLKKLLIPFLAVVTLGLAPFTPEPHFFGKMRWVLGGAEGMQAADYFDLIMHGAPWIYFMGSILLILYQRTIKSSTKS